MTKIGESSTGRIARVSSMNRLRGGAPLGDKEVMSEAIKRLLEHPSWPEDVKAFRIYEREGDSGDGLAVRVVFGADGDAWVSISTSLDAARFCTKSGGGRSLRTRAALLILAEAIRLDNEEGR